MSTYKWCAVPQCTNTSLKTPEKLFVRAPMNIKVRKKWLELARRNPADISHKTVIFFCEDHFDLEKDMANYCQYKMGFSKKMIMKDGVMPSKFHCQPDRRKRTCDADTSRPAYAKRQRNTLIEQCKGEDIQPSQPVDEPLIVNVENVTIESTCDKHTSTESIITAEKSTQHHSTHKVQFRSKAVQTRIFTRDTQVSPYKFSTTSSCTSPFKIDRCSCHVKPSKSGFMNIKKIICFDEEKSDSDVSLSTEAPRQDTSSSYAVTSSKLSESGSNITDTNEDVLKMQSHWYVPGSYSYQY